MQEELPWFATFSDFGYVASFRRYSRSKSEVVQNWPKFCMFLAPIFLEGERPPELLELDYKIQPVSYHVVKFLDGRPRDLPELLFRRRNKRNDSDSVNSDFGAI